MGWQRILSDLKNKIRRGLRLIHLIIAERNALKNVAPATPEFTAAEAAKTVEMARPFPLASPYVPASSAPSTAVCRRTKG